MNRLALMFWLCAPGALVLTGCGSSSSGGSQGSLPPGITATDGAASDSAASGGTDASSGGSQTDGATAGETGAGGEAGAGASGGDGAASDGTVVCNTFANAAPAITSQAVAEAAPALTGGTIANGTYFLTALTEYRGDAGMAATGGLQNTTIEVSGTTIQVNSSGTTSTETVVTSGTNLFTDTRTCPGPATRDGTYTATPTMLIVQFDDGTADGGTSIVQETFTLQP
jgi:hypothetical protein